MGTGNGIHEFEVARIVYDMEWTGWGFLVIILYKKQAVFCTPARSAKTLPLPPPQ